MRESVTELHEQIRTLQGTSPEKIAALTSTVRKDGASSLVMGLMERIPKVGPIVKFILVDLQQLPADELDELLEHAALVVRELRSDEHVTTVECLECDGSCDPTGADGERLHEHVARCACGWKHTNNGAVVCDIKASRHVDSKARGDRGPISDDERAALDGAT